MMQGPWQDDNIALVIEGSASAAVVRITQARLRSRRQMSVGAVLFDVTRLASGDAAGVLKFRLNFAPDETNSSGYADWPLFSDKSDSKKLRFTCAIPAQSAPNGEPS